MYYIIKSKALPKIRLLFVGFYLLHGRHIMRVYMSDRSVNAETSQADHSMKQCLSVCIVFRFFVNIEI